MARFSGAILSDARRWQKIVVRPRGSVSIDLKRLFEYLIYSEEKPLTYGQVFPDPGKASGWQITARHVNVAVIQTRYTGAYGTALRGDSSM